MKKRFCGVCVAVAVIIAASAGAARLSVRPPVGAGILYPDEKQKIVDALYKFYTGLPPAPQDMKMVGCIVPYSPFGLSGGITARALGHLQPGDYKRVVVLGASTVSPFEGCSIPDVEAYATPLGLVPLDREAVGHLITRSNFFSLRSVRNVPTKHHPFLHEIETSIEAVLPFLQERLGSFTLVPIVVGKLVEPEVSHGIGEPARQDVYKTLEGTARALGAVLDEDTLLVVTAEFTHYGPDYKFTPFRTDVAEGIQALDEEAFALILNKDWPALDAYLNRTKNTLTGVGGISLLMKVLSPEISGTLMGYDTSGRIFNTPARSVSYAALGFFMPRAAEAPAQPPAEAGREAAESQ